MFCYETFAVNGVNSELCVYCVEFQADVVNKVDSAAAGDGQLGTNGESTGVVKKLLLESMLKSVQAMLKQQHSSQQPGQYCVYTICTTHYTAGSLTDFKLIILLHLPYFLP